MKERPPGGIIREVPVAHLIPLEVEVEVGRAGQSRSLFLYELQEVLLLEVETGPDKKQG